jgi:hypothetical protein
MQDEDDKTSLDVLSPVARTPSTDMAISLDQADTLIVMSEADEHMQYSLEEDDHIETVVLEDSSR